MLIEQDELRIRNAVPADAPILTRWWNDGAVMAHAGFPNGLGTTEAEVRGQIETDTEEHRRCILEVDDIPVGEMNYRALGEGRVEIGIKICEASYQNGGRGTRFLRLFIDSLFREHPFSSVILDTNLKNVRAQHVYEKLGFRRLRVNQNAWTDQNGVPQSSVDYALTKADFYQIKLETALPEDAKTLTALQKAAFAPLYEAYRDETSPYCKDEANYLTWLAHPSIRYFKALHAGVIVGGLAYILRESGEVYLARLYIDPRWQGRGLAKKTVAAGDALFPDAPSFSLDFPVDRMANRACYEANGYRDTGERQTINEHLTLAIYRKPGQHHD